jgi:CMP-N-acetylneuraminic acid synthetase
MNDIVAMIPVRKGSQRLKKKNYLDFGGVSILENMVSKCVESGVFDAIYLNTDDHALESIADKYNINFLLREAELADSNATSDKVVYDFIKRVPCKKVVWVNTASPLQTVKDIKKSVIQFLECHSKSFVAVNAIRTHCVMNNEPMNFKYTDSFAKTQDIAPILKFVYSTMGWDVHYFRRKWEQGYCGLFDEKCKFIEVSDLAGILLKTDLDYQLVNAIRKGRSK